MIRPIGFVDCWAFSAALHVKFKDRFGGGEGGYDFLPLRSSEGPLPILGEWKTAKGLLARITTAAVPVFGTTPELGEAMLIRLLGGGILPWSFDEPSDWRSFALGIVPAPGSWLYSGGEAAVLPVGQLTLIDRHVPYSAVNFSNNVSITLVINARKPFDPLGDVE